VRPRLLAGVAAVVSVAALGAGAAIYAAKEGASASSCGRIGDRERAVSPDGLRSAFVRCMPDGSAWLYVGARGVRARRVVPRQFDCCYRPSESVVFRNPAWSPDGSRLAVVIEDVGGTDVWVVDPARASARRVTAGPARERDPSWSADGRRIAFRTETGGRMSVAVSSGSS
jgi:Tol biopolymer transport system component